MHRVPGSARTNEWQVTLLPAKSKLHYSASLLELGVCLRIGEKWSWLPEAIIKRFTAEKLTFEQRAGDAVDRSTEFLLASPDYFKAQSAVASIKCAPTLLELPDALIETLRQQDDAKGVNFKEYSTAELADRWAKLSSPVFASLYPFQRAGVEFLWRMNGRGIIADEMGLGKTVQAIAFMRALELLEQNNDPLLVIAPKSAVANWMRQLSQWGLADEQSVAVPKSRQQGLFLLSGAQQPPTKKRKRDAPSKVYIVTYGLTWRLIDSLVAFKFSKIIIDESQALRNIESKQSQACDRLCKLARHVVLLSGTPANRPLELYAQLRQIRPWIFPTLWKPYPGKFYAPESARAYVPKDYKFGGFSYAWRYCDPQPYRRKVRGNVVTDFKLKQACRIVELGSILHRFALISRSKAEVQQQLPPIIRVAHWLVPSTEDTDTHSKQIEALEPVKKVSEDLWRTQLMDLYNTKMPGLKWPLLKSYLTDQFTTGMFSPEGHSPRAKIIMFAYHREMVDDISKLLTELSVPHFSMDGTADAQTRAANEKKFRTATPEECRVAVLSYAFHFAINMEAGEYVVFTEYPWEPAKIVQAEARCHRLITRHGVTAIYTLVKKSLEDRFIWPLTQNKQRTGQLLLSSAFLQDPSSCYLEGIRIDSHETIQSSHAAEAAPPA